MRVVHIITALDTGGAQNFLMRLLKTLPPEVENHVIALGTLEPMGERIASLGVPVSSLGMKPGIPDPRAILALADRLKVLQPDIVHTWMYHADLIGGLAAKLAGIDRVIWCIRLANFMSSGPKRSTWLVANLSGLLSRVLPRTIVCCAQAAVEDHAALGYARERMTVILNGLDTTMFRPDPTARAEVRAELGLADGQSAIGIAGRFHAQKNFPLFFRAAQELAAWNSEIVFVFAGPGVTAASPEVAAATASLGDRCRLLGDRTDMRRVLNALDILVSPSLAEGFPNVVAEAMATGKPCVATDVGDTRVVISDAGRLVPSGELEPFVEAIKALVLMSEVERAELGNRAREHICRNFDIAGAAKNYFDLYLSMMAS